MESSTLSPLYGAYVLQGPALSWRERREGSLRDGRGDVKAPQGRRRGRERRRRCPRKGRRGRSRVRAAGGGSFGRRLAWRLPPPAAGAASAAEEGPVAGGTGRSRALSSPLRGRGAGRSRSPGWPPASAAGRWQTGGPAPASGQGRRKGPGGVQGAAGEERKGGRKRQSVKRCRRESSSPAGWMLRLSSKQSFQQPSVCHTFEKEWLECSEGIGLTRAKEECRLEAEDLEECMTKRKMMQRVRAILKQRDLMIKEGKYTPPNYQSD
ncbi:NADH dehydrogenase [Crotalus adamanteus]|uniref:NADH dehydrogenase [ubiquinone] iron-sulfur protein 5 n=1 Tax=Crotalus adamanteus TaxID=8729 RepID=A0AAW1AY48_CROAD